jgi:hypothetical protein
MYRHENLASILEVDEQLNEYFNMFEDAPRSRETKKEPKMRDITNFTESTKRSDQIKFGSSRGGDGSGRNGRGRRGEDFFI